MEVRGKRILITGANGFIGGRLAERLAQEQGARVRGLVRDAKIAQAFENRETEHSSRLTSHVSRPTPHEFAIGDVVDPDAMRRAIAGCDAVIHCAAMQTERARLDDYRRVNVDGTLNVLRAARDANVARVIHISTINVHGIPPPRDANADSPLGAIHCWGAGRGAINCAPTCAPTCTPTRAPTHVPDFYSISKAEGERAAWQFARENNLALTVIRPGCTYGPRSRAWTLTPLERIRRHRPVLIGSGDGMCNAIYIDNLVDLILLALENDDAIGHAFIGTEGRGVTWREFYGAYAAMLGGKRLFGMPRVVALALTLPFELLARVDGYPPRLARASVEFYSHRVVFDIEKSKRLLGYVPRVSFEDGMSKTAAWLRAERIL
jgi:nucleoside-diphosphate-sugar epimerase